MVITSQICGAVFLAYIAAVDFDVDRWNYLFHSNNVSAGGCPGEIDARGTVDVAYSSSAKLPFEEGRDGWVKIWAECTSTYRWDDKDFRYYRSWICSATTVVVDP